MNLIFKDSQLNIKLFKVSRKGILFHASVTTNVTHLEKKNKLKIR